MVILCLVSVRCLFHLFCLEFFPLLIIKHFFSFDIVLFSFDYLSKCGSKEGQQIPVDFAALTFAS